MAHSNALFGYTTDEGERFRRPIDLYRGYSINLPYARWQMRVAKIYGILSLVGEITVGMVSWQAMRNYALNRGYVLGGLIDYASQATVGSVRNLQHYPGNRDIQVITELALAWTCNFGWVKTKEKGEKCLCINVGWFRRTDVVAHIPRGRVEIVNEGMTRGNVTVDDDWWWIESRANFESVVSKDVDYPIITELAPWNQRSLRRCGLNVTSSHESPYEQVVRILTFWDWPTDQLRYRHNEDAGPVVRRLCVTNDRCPRRWLAWSRPLDEVIKGVFEDNVTPAYVANALASVSLSTPAGEGVYHGLSDFSGLLGP